MLATYSSSVRRNRFSWYALCISVLGERIMPKQEGSPVPNEATDDPIITVRLKKGMADRHRLPLSDVLSVLEEIRQMIAEVGRRLQRERGIDSPKGDFGLEVIAVNGNSIFRRGSVEMPLAMTTNVDLGILAAQEVIRTFGALEDDRGVPEPNRHLDKTLLRRMSRVAQVQRRDRMELEMRLQRPGFPEEMTTTFGSAGMDSLKALQAPTFQVEGVSIYGKLTQLTDHDPMGQEERGFWGELVQSDGESWRVQFKADDVATATALFRKQVLVTGKAVYYRVATHKIIVESIEMDSERDYEAAFDELFGKYKGVFNSDLKTLIKQMREDD
jgi:hypothetical protein